MYASQKLPMFTSSFSNIVSPTRFYVDNMMGYLVDDNLNPSNYHSSYYHLPSPLIHDKIDIFGDPFSHHELALIQQSLRPNSSIITDDSSTFEVTAKMDSSKLGDQETVNGIVEDGSQNNEDMTRASASHGLKRRRTSKKDRHSKIRTAHGLRDRRMRLSLEIASPFFKLQDMLGFDKASSTVEWLLLQSKQAIEELYDHRAPNEVLTKCASMSNSNSHGEEEVKEITNSKGRRGSTIAKEKNPKEKRKETTKESRKDARARARNRTLKKFQISTRQLLDQGHGNDERLRAHSNFDPFNYMMEECIESNNSIEARDIIHHGSLKFNYNQASEISQIVPSYRISMQQDIMKGPLR